MKDHVYKLIELTGTSTTSIEDAVDKAIKRACQRRAERISNLVIGNRINFSSVMLA